jgi:branched-chain amino acid transport system ATP-binding protein
MSVLRAERITAGYSKVPVIRDIHVGAEEGKVVAIVGPNGAGKSTLLKAIFGLVKLTEGSVTLGGADISGWPPHLVARQGMAYVPQVENVFPSMSIYENLEMGAFTRKSGVHERAKEVLEIFPDLAAAGRKQAGTLSGGQRNMLGMARALMLEPRVVLLDEPTAGLSPRYTEVVWEQVGRIAQIGTAVVVVEQNVDLALSHADHVYVMVAGRNRLDGPAREVAKEDLPSIFLGGNPHQAADGITTEHGPDDHAAPSNQRRGGRGSGR